MLPLQKSPNIKRIRTAHARLKEICAAQRVLIAYMSNIESGNKTLPNDGRKIAKALDVYRRITKIVWQTKSYKRKKQRMMSLYQYSDIQKEIEAILNTTPMYFGTR